MTTELLVTASLIAAAVIAGVVYSIREIHEINKHLDMILNNHNRRLRKLEELDE